MLISASEESTSEPIAVHFHTLSDADPSLHSLSLREGQYAVRGTDLSNWVIHGPLSFDEIDTALESGEVVDEVIALSRTSD